MKTQKHQTNRGNTRTALTFCCVQENTGYICCHEETNTGQCLKDKEQNKWHQHTKINNYFMHNRKEKKKKKSIQSSSEDCTQPQARQSLVQLAPVWGRITDPQTVQTTTSGYSEQRGEQLRNTNHHLSQGSSKLCDKTEIKIKMACI